MQSINFDQTINAWSSIAGNVFVPHTEEEYDRLVEILDRLIDKVGQDESHPLASLMEVIGVLIEAYETEYIPQLEEKNLDDFETCNLTKIIECDRMGRFHQGGALPIG